MLTKRTLQNNFKKFKIFGKLKNKFFCEKPNQNKEYTSFGFKDVPKEDRQSKVNEVFSNVAKR